MRRSGLWILFSTLLLDLIGFGMIIPLISVYGRHYGASGLSLSLLGGVYSLMQFFFAPLWGSLSDRFGRRPILLLSLAGSSFSYLLFGLSARYEMLLISRILGGIFAANISTAHAAMADITSSTDRTRGMGLLGAAFGIGFTIGPPFGGLAASSFGLSAPGLIAAALCGFNFFFAIFRLPETLPPEKRSSKLHSFSLIPPLWKHRGILTRPSPLRFFILEYFFYILAFSMMEQTFSLFLQHRFRFETSVAGYQTGVLLMISGFLGALFQGVLIKPLGSRFQEHQLLIFGLGLKTLSVWVFPLLTHYWQYFFLMVPLAISSSFVHPFLFSFISKHAPPEQQGLTSGITQSMASLARAIGPFLGLWSFSQISFLPYLLSGLVHAILCVACLFFFLQPPSSRQKK